MDKVLIVDSDPEVLERLRDSIEKLHQFEVLCVSDGEKAMEILKTIPVSVFVTDTNIEKIDGLELIAYVTRKLRGTPCVVMSSYGRPWFHKPREQSEILYHVEKPVNMVSLVSAIFVGLTLRDEGEAGKGISLSSFLPLLEIERKTCRLEVLSPAKGRGYLYFEEGVLIDAHYDDLPPEDAATEMIEWENISLNIGELPRRRYQKRVNVNLMEIIGATWDKEKIGMGEMDEDFSDEVDAPSQKLGERSFARFRRIMGTQIDKFRAIKGYKGIGILDSQLRTVASDFANEDLDLEAMVASFKPVFLLCSKITVGHGFSACRMFTAHTEEAVVQILQSRYGDGNEDAFYLVGLAEAYGNWFFIKFELENLERQLKESLKKPTSR